MSFGKIDLSGRNAVIADCVSGMGYDAAMGLAAVGANLILVSRSLRAGAAALAEARAKGVKAAVIACDVTQRLSVENMVEQAVDGFGGIDILINNAAVNSSSMSAGRTEAHSGLKSAYLMGRVVVQQMIKQGKGGKIVNVASMAALNLDNGRGGLSQMSKIWALELIEYGINVNALEPRRERMPVWARGEAAAPAPRLEHIAGPVIFLSSDWANCITGATLHVNGDWLR
jgi:NAD(P)-dependent dehydrogenase (short-subunit alcohol dehydrogenase family)